MTDRRFRGCMAGRPRRGDQVEMMIMRIVWQCTSTH